MIVVVLEGGPRVHRLLKGPLVGIRKLHLIGDGITFLLLAIFMNFLLLAGHHSFTPMILSGVLIWCPTCVQYCRVISDYV